LSIVTKDQRVVEGEESDEFIEMFGGRFEVTGSSDSNGSCFRHVSTIKKKREIRLYEVTNDEKVPLRLRCPHLTSLKPDSAYLIDDGRIVGQWVGDHVPYRFKSIAGILKGQLSAEYPNNHCFEFGMCLIFIDIFAFFLVKINL
jgi:hypothetical protein